MSADMYGVHILQAAGSGERRVQPAEVQSNGKERSLPEAKEEVRRWMMIKLPALIEAAMRIVVETEALVKFLEEREAYYLKARAEEIHAAAFDAADSLLQLLNEVVREVAK
jgi:hypothetical protein